MENNQFSFSSLVLRAGLLERNSIACCLESILYAPILNHCKQGNSYIMCVQINNYLVNKREYYSWSLDYWCVASIEFQLLRSSCRFELVMSVGLRVCGESQLISRPAGVSAAELSTRRQSRSIVAKVLVDEKDQFLLVGTILNIVKVQYFHS